MSIAATKHLSAHDLRRVSVEAGTDPRTVVAYVDALHALRSTTRARIERALVRLDFGHLVHARRVSQ